MPIDIDLKGQQFEEFQGALEHAFPSYDQLEMMSMHKLGAYLPSISSRVNVLPKVTYDLIGWAKSEGKLSTLLAGALETNKGNHYLRRFALKVSLTSDVPPDGRLQNRVLEGVPFLRAREAGPIAWRQMMHDAELCVCRVEIPADESWGTGFLVGPDVVMTNWHVAKLVDEKGVAPGQVAMRFDYKEDASGQTQDGQACALAPEWLLDNSPEKELDYALVRLAEKVGETRGKLTPQPFDFQPNLPLFILQHPDGGPLNVQVGSIVSVNTLHKRVNYTTNTAGGSSGSPCFTMTWGLVALHHYGQNTSNMGIPLKDIKAHVRQTKPALADELGW